MDCTAGTGDNRAAESLDHGGVQMASRYSNGREVDSIKKKIKMQSGSCFFSR